VLTHEVGLQLGFGEGSNPSDVMDELLAPGVRRLNNSEEVATAGLDMVHPADAAVQQVPVTAAARSVADVSSETVAVRRTMFTADLNIVDTDSGPDGVPIEVVASAESSEPEKAIADGIAQSSQSPYLLFSGDLHTLIASNGSREVAVPNAGPSGMPSAAALATSRFDLGSFEDNFSGRNGFALSAIRSGNDDVLGIPLVEEVGQPAELVPDASGSPQDDQPGPAGSDDQFESIPAPSLSETHGATAVIAVAQAEEPTWFMESLTKQAADQGTSADQWTAASEAAFAENGWTRSYENSAAEILLATSLVAMPEILNASRDLAPRRYERRLTPGVRWGSC